METSGGGILRSGLGTTRSKGVQKVIKHSMGTFKTKCAVCGNEKLFDKTMAESEGGVFVVVEYTCQCGTEAKIKTAKENILPEWVEG